MSQFKHQSGFAIIELLLLLVVVGLIGFIGWRVFDADNTKFASDNSQVPTISAPAVNSAADLDKASTALDSTDIDDTSDSAQLNSELETF